MEKHDGCQHKTVDHNKTSCCLARCLYCSGRNMSVTKPAEFKHSRRHNFCRRLLGQVTYLLIVLVTSCSAQTPRPFPTLMNVATERPVRTIPAMSTCGVQARNAYCESSTDPISVQVCTQKFCEQTCPGRTALPPFAAMLKGTSDGYLQCVDPDTVNVRPGSSPGNSATSFYGSGASCYLVPASQPAVGANGAFTVTSWIWLGEQGQGLGTLLEKRTSLGMTVLRVLVGTGGVTVAFASASGQQSATLNYSIPQQSWTHLAIQAYLSPEIKNRSLSFFVNGIRAGFTPVSTVIPADFIMDSLGTYRVGQTFDGTLQFLGKIQDLQFYSDTLSNREIQEVFSGTLPEIRIQSACRCPGSRPRVKPQDTRYCLPNGVPDNAGDVVLRVSSAYQPVEYANDGNSNTMWVSMIQDDVTLEMDLGDQFEIFYVMVQFYSPLPEAVVVQRLLSGQDTWQPWQYYAVNCMSYFGLQNNGPLLAANSVNCLQLGASTPLPYSKGNITFSLLAPDPVPRPGFLDFYNTPLLQQFVQASKLRIQFRNHTLITNVRHEYYAIYEIFVTGRCDCNGHASTCNVSSFPYKCLCTQESHTQGDKCSECQPLYNNKPFRRGDQQQPYSCQPCTCNGHATSCVYNTSLDTMPAVWTEGGGGVCVNCQDSTEGRYCEKCRDGFFRPVGKSLFAIDVCSLCACNTSGTVNASVLCEKDGGNCPCKVNVEGRACDRCKAGYYSLQAGDLRGCTACQCDVRGTVGGDSTCNEVTGICNCKQNVRGPKCTECKFGYYMVQEVNSFQCLACNCNPFGSSSVYCDPSTGQCLCKQNVQGHTCDQCVDGYYNFDAGCIPCNCNLAGTVPDTICDRITGNCMCKANTIGRDCSACRQGTYNFGVSADRGCMDCSCNTAGTINGQTQCNVTTGACICKANVQGLQCNFCKTNTYGLSAFLDEGCHLCDCDTSGTQSQQLACEQNTGQCICLSGREGRRCDSCTTGFYKSAETLGCLLCNCHPDGTLPNTNCNKSTGQCECRTNYGVGGRDCSQCLGGFYSFASGRCSPCNCNTYGSVNQTCNMVTGNCTCKQFTEGRDCGTCQPGSSNLAANNPYGCSKDPSQQPSPVYSPLSPTAMALTWRPPDYPNGVISSYQLYRNNTKIYDGPANSFNDTGLQPYTLYAYRVVAFNIQGSTSSPAVVFRTNPGVPSSDMVLSVTEISVTSARCIWNEPSQLNGPLQKYELVSYDYTNQSVSKVEWVGLARDVLLTTLRAYYRYNLTARACTQGGCSESAGVQFLTKSAPPAGMPTPLIIALSSSDLLITWQPPVEPNGIIIFYELWMRGLAGPDGVRNPEQSLIFHASGQYNPLPGTVGVLEPLATNYTVTGLSPFTVYEFQVLAENSAGKAASLWASGRTLEASPLFMPAPVVSGVSSTVISIVWHVPDDSSARGNISVYRLYQLREQDLSIDPYGPPTFWQLVTELSGSVNSYYINNLTPYSLNTFKVEACNHQGCVNSTASSGRTLPAAPAGMVKPVVDGFNSTVMAIKWAPPISPNGPEPTYTVQKTNIALSYPASVVRGTRFPGAGFYVFAAETLPQNVDFTGIRFEFRLQQASGLLMFAASASQNEYIAVLFKNGRPRFMYDTQACPAETEVDGTQGVNANMTSLDDRQDHTLEVRRLGISSSIVVDGLYTGCKENLGVYTFNDEGLAYNDLKWHTLEALRFNGIYANITIDHKWTGCQGFLGISTVNDEGKTYSNKERHTFEARRFGLEGSVRIDTEWRGTGKIRDPNCQNSSIIGATTAFYVGGVPIDYVLRRDDGKNSVLESVFSTSFQGCIYKVEVMKQMYPQEVWEELDWSQAKSYELAFLNWQGCPINLQSGIHFMGKGYMVVPNCVSGECLLEGNSLEISFRMRTSLHTGNLLLVHGGTGVYIAAFLQNGGLNFTFSSGTVVTFVAYSDHNNTLCDGQWHNITFAKIGQQGSITVDGLTPVTVGNASVSMNVLTSFDIYMGGIKPQSTLSQFIEQNRLSLPTEGFGGCISNLNLNKRALDLSAVRDLVNINLDGCPPFHVPEQTCQDSLVAEVYHGPETIAYEGGLLPYTDYIYRVAAENEIGITYSGWSYGRTKEGVPVGVSGPLGVRALNGYVLEVEWKEPQSSSGLLMKYVISAYNLDQPQEPPVMDDVLDANQEAINMTNLIPNTKYLIKISACTHGGCTESSEGVEVLMPVEAPADVAAPFAVATSSSLLVKWNLPAKPNGNITGYFLYQDGEQVYAGGEQQYLITGLQVFTSYQFYVRACTIAGCTDGPKVALTTAQLPPTLVKPPVLQVLDTKRIEVRWERPDQTNGLLERYLVFASRMADARGDAVYNTTMLYTEYVIPNLLAGTTYFISVGACTGGGCTVSNVTSATTAESAPEGVAAPVVTSPSSSQLVVTWKEPDFPNGRITRYDLYQNGIGVAGGMVMSYSVGNLLPYSRHLFRLRACTAQGCGYSVEVEARTQEAAPVGLVVLVGSVVDSRTVNVSWTQPVQANGLLYFDVYFEGLFFADPGAWNYTTVQNRTSLLQKTVANQYFLITSLIPMSEYKMQVNASNSKGFILSNVVPVNMPPGSPDGMKPPVVVADSSTSLLVRWDAVGRVNAREDVAYTVEFRQRDSDFIQNDFGPTTTQSYRKTNLVPYTSYQFRVRASNSYGIAVSPWVEQTTQQDKPLGVNAPQLSEIEARYINLTWTTPINPNGIITAYNVYQNGMLMKGLAGNVTAFQAGGLTPFQVYSFQIEACTTAGCTKSASSSVVRTPEAVPDGITAPILRSVTPTMIEVTWSPPSGPNGIVLSYVLERKLADSGGPIMLLNTFQPGDAKAYVDESTALRPFTAYSYRIKVVNSAGTGEGPWANITTASARPAGVASPVLTVQGPTSVQVNWSRPVQPNGIIELYLIRTANLQKEIRNFTSLMTVLEGLIPFTTYSVTLTACTSAGCTESIPASARTDPAVPSGQGPPTAQAISQSAVFVQWMPPASPNGPNLRYELSRKKILQPLDTTAQDIGEWRSLYLGTELLHEDTNLPMFTTFVYRITAVTDIGQVVSNDSQEVTTFGGFPRRAPIVSAIAISHLEIFVNWTLPDPVDLQGGVENLTLFAQSVQKNITEYPKVVAKNFTVQNLVPHTDFNIVLLVTVFGGASISSTPLKVTTLDGAPTGMIPPVLTIVSETSLRVAWMEPQNPNGQITAYNVIVNGRSFSTGMTQPASVVMTDLQPYTVYEVKVEACTVFGCSQSESTFGTTAEAQPGGLVSPTVTPANATAVVIVWAPPSSPNGIILRYELWRKTTGSCGNPTLGANVQDSKQCTYVECSIFESICGSQCFTGAKVCCGGVLHDVVGNYSCCGVNYLLKSSSSAVCCSGKFYEPKQNYRCCGNRYTQVLPGEVCCASPTEDRVSSGMGDSCCAGLPYAATGAQICCGGLLQPSYKHQCCGGQVVSDQTLCCGNSTVGQAYLPQSGYACCGQVFAQADTSLCCKSSTGQTKIHYYDTRLEKEAANVKCCGLETVSAGLSCCNYVGYNPSSQTCADRSSVSQTDGCGNGAVCPISQVASAVCDRCDFNTRTTQCNAVQGDLTLNTTDPGLFCTDSEERVYSGMALTYTDVGLLPYTQYQYSVRVVNSAGSSVSPYISTQTLEALPAFVQPPTVKVDPSLLYIISLTWKPPLQRNGNITQYILLRDGVELFRSLEMNFTDDRNVLPYRTYSYVLSVCNSAGCANSSTVTVATAQGIPEGVVPPQVTVVGATSLNVAVQPPGQPNGQVLGYTVLIAGLNQTYNVPAPQTVLVTGLKPFTAYNVTVTVCTQAGCANSSSTTVTTAEAAPGGVTAPRVVIASSMSVKLFWRPPTVMNGQLSGYRVLLQDAGSEREVYAGLEPNCTVASLLPGQAYGFVVEARTAGGSTRSAETDITMPSSTPALVPPPDTVSVMSATQIFISWSAVVSNEGPIDQYRVLLNIGQETEVEKGVGTALNAVVSGLKPYTVYEVRLQACLQGVPSGCSTSDGVFCRTFEAPPTGQPAPSLTALSSNTVQINWQSPTEPNGIITNYRIFRRSNGQADTEILINQVSGDVFSFVHSGQDLLPYSLYQYGVMAVNSQGQTQVAYSTVRTLQAPPVGMSAPLVNRTGAYGIFLAWSPPRQPNGVISSYNIYVRQTSDSGRTIVLTVGGTTTATTISGLEPFSQYLVRVEAVNIAGNVSSVEVPVSTAQASPSGLSAFQVEKITTGTSVILSWEPPAKPYGGITIYRIYERDSDAAVYSGTGFVFEFRHLQPYTQYFVRQEACNDAGCTVGGEQAFTTAEIAPTDQPSPVTGMVNATHVLLRWVKPANPNGQITAYEVFRKGTALRRRRQATGGNSDDGEVVYRTTATNQSTYEFLDSGLRPYTQYEYKIRASNSQGFADSQWQTIQTSQAPPQGVVAPVVMLLDGEVNAVNITWSPPSQPNGVLTSYSLRTNSSTPFTLPPGGPFWYKHDGLEAYTVYSFTLTVCSGGGCTTSEPAIIRTKESAPYSVFPPAITPLNSSAVKAAWVRPQVSNGEITTYQLRMDGSVVYEGLAMEYVVSGLAASQDHTFNLTACTRGGCTQSPAVTGHPDDAPPADLDPPVLHVLSATAIEVSWSPPRSPNGIITSYDVRRGGQLVFTTTLGQSGSLQTAYTDFGLQPGEEYTYTVIARNRQGSVESPAARAQTSASSPSGLAPPTLQAVSSTAIRASWAPPINPNGRIANYSLYRDNTLVYSSGAEQLSYTVPGLSYFTRYAFRLQACTDRGCALTEAATAQTLEAAPELQEAPSLTALASASGAHAGVLAAWLPPVRPNGVLLGYELLRRVVTQGDTGELYGDAVSVYNGTSLQMTDTDRRVLPYHTYQYMVVSANSVGTARSPWARVSTRQAPPTTVAAPVILTVTPTTITVLITPPAEPNGIVKQYNILVNGNVEASGLTLQQTAGDAVPLSPFTAYTVQVQACTSGGCANSSGVTVRTSSVKPSGLKPVSIVEINSTAVSLAWTYPAIPSGVILRFIVYRRLACPPAAQPFSQPPCVPGDSKELYRGLGTTMAAGGLTPYTAYEFLLQAENGLGGVDSPVWVRTVTASEAPQYVKTPVLTKNGSLAVVDWTQSFALNGQLREFVLSADGEVVQRGGSSVGGVERLTSDRTITLVIQAVTVVGQTQSPAIVFDPSAVDNIGVTEAPVTAMPSTEEKKFYEEVWFIIIIVIVGILIIFVIVALCFRHSYTHQPYIRERMPLESHPNKRPRDLYVIDASDGSVIDGMQPPSRMSGSSLGFQGPGLGVVNPAFANDRDLQSMSLDGMSSSIEEDTAWERNYDSGLFDEEEDLDSLNEASYSYSREQMVFTDTHL